MKMNIKSALLCFACFLSINIISAQTFNDGPMELQIRVTEVRVDYHPDATQSNDFNLSGSIGGIIGQFISVPSLESDEITCKVWARDNVNLAWQGGTCMLGQLPMSAGGPETFAVSPPVMTFTYTGQQVPQFFDLRLEAWEDDKSGDFDDLPSGVPFVLSNNCQSPAFDRCVYSAGSTNCITLFGAGVLAMESDIHCDANPFQTDIDYRAAGPPCQWNDHGFTTGVCPQNNYYQVHVQSYYRFTVGTACNNSIDLGTLASGGTLTHYNSNECYSNTLVGSRPGNDVYYKFHINNPIGIDINMCNSTTLFDTYIYLLDGNCNIIDENDDGQGPGCGTKSLLSRSLCVPGDYYVVVDGKNANSLGSFRIFVTENTDFTFAASIVKKDPKCTGDGDGWAEVNITGGLGPYTILWSNGYNDTLNQNLAAGTYSVQVSDQSACVTNDTVTLVDPAPVLVTVTTKDLTCSGANDGEATANVTGGSGTYFFGWNTVPPQNGSTAVLLPAGTYSVDVFDSEGCFASGAGTVSANNPIIINEDSVFNVSCNGNGDGRIYLHITGGVLPYSYAWSQNVSTDTIATGLMPGSYSFTVFDNTTSPQCFATKSFNITEPDLLVSAIADIRNVTCNGGTDGGVDLEVSGGKLPYAYLWTDGSTRGDLLGSAAGNVSVVVTDGNGCITTTDTVLTEPSAIVPVITVLTDAGCNGNNGGSVDLEVTGGTSPYSYNWSPNDEVTQDITTLVAGNYSVVITDATGCVKVDDVTITESKLTVVRDITNPSCIGKEDGAVSLTVSGTGPFSYIWDNGSTSQTLTELSSGSYTVTVTDASPDSCSEVVTVPIADPTSNCNVGTFDVAVPNVFSPNNDGTNDHFDIYAAADVSRISVKIYDRWGAKIYDNPNQIPNIPNQGWDGSIFGKDAQLGPYVYVMEIEYSTPNTTDRPIQKTGTVTVVR